MTNLPEPKLSLVTGTVNRHAEIRRLIASIHLHTTVDWQLIVVDASDEPVIWDDPRVTILEDRPRTCYTAAYNRGFRAATGEWVIYLNDDAEVLAGYAENAIAFMERNPHIGLGCLYYSNAGGPFAVNVYADMIYANFGILRRELGNKLGWFREELRMYGTDNALTFDVLLVGYGVAGIENARLLHHETADQERHHNQTVGREDGHEWLQVHYARQFGEMLKTYTKTLEAVR